MSPTKGFSGGEEPHLSASHVSADDSVASPDLSIDRDDYARESHRNMSRRSSSTLHNNMVTSSNSANANGEADIGSMREKSGKETSATEKERDLEAGYNKPEAIPNAPVKEKVLASDGSEVVVVDWEGPDDPANPKNWPKRSRMGATLIVAAFTFLSPLSSSMISPAASQVSRRFGITNAVEESMLTSIFVLAYAFGPLFLGPLSELYGRTIVLQLANLLYLVMNLVCGFAPNTGSFLAFRFLAGLGGSAPLGIGAGVLGDLWRPEERGQAAALYSLGPLIGPAIGPVCGAWIAEKLPNNGYVWVFYSTSIFCAFVQLAGLIWLRETYAPIILFRKAKAMKKERGLPADSDHIKTVFEVKQGTKTHAHIVTHGLVRPFVLFVHEPILQVLALYVALIYGIIYLLIVTITPVFTEIYEESVGIAGLNYLALGLGFFVWSQIGARLLDVVYRKLKARNGDGGRPEYRLPMLIPASLYLPAGLFIYGWAAEKRVHWFVADIGLFLIAMGMIGVFQPINLYIVDTFTLYAASALAAAACARSLCGFGFPLFAPYMFAKLGYGGGCSLLAGLAILIGCPAGPVLYKYGEQIRLKSKYARKA